MDMVWKVHNDALAYLLGSMQGNRTATRRQTVLNGPEGRHLSDGYFTGQDGNVYVVDTSIAWNNDLAGRYRRKMRHAEVPEYFIPFVFTMDGKIYEESRKRIQAAAPEITDDVLAHPARDAPGEPHHRRRTRNPRRPQPDVPRGLCALE